MAAPRPRKLDERLGEDGPRRVLALDGGGHSPAVALGMLAGLEMTFQRRASDARVRLSDYFDLIAGAGPAALIAASLAMGRRVVETFDLWTRFAAAEAADRSASKSTKATARGALVESAFAGARIAEAGLQTGLAVFLRDAAADGPTTVTNSPFAVAPTSGSAPAQWRLDQIVLASSAASGEKISARPDPDGPAGAFLPLVATGLGASCLASLMAATIKTYGFGFETGPDRLLLTSVGAGWTTGAERDSAARDLACAEALCLTPRPASMLAGDGVLGQMTPVPLAHFQRFDVTMAADDIAALGFADPAAVLGAHAQQNWALLRGVGQEAVLAALAAPAATGVGRAFETEAFPTRFDPPEFPIRPPAPPKIRLEALGRVFAKPTREAD